jgi:hypothetical protein
MPWLHNDLTEKAVATAFPATPAFIDSYVTPWNGQQHVNYFDAQGQIHELFYDGSNWHHTPLSQQAKDIPRASPRLPANPNAIVGYASSWNQQQHIQYIDSAGHINELYFDGGWHHTNFIDLFDRSIWLTLGWPAVQGLIAAYPTEWNSQQHIFYIGGPAASVHELYYAGGHWHPNNLASPSLNESLSWGMHGYTTPWNQQQHIVVITAAGSIDELYYTDHWISGVLGSDPHASNLQHNRAIHGHVSAWNKQQHVIYIDRTDHIEELLYVDGTSHWTQNDLTALATKTNGGVSIGVAGSPGGSSVRAVNGYVTPWNQQQHVNYVDSSGFLNELLYNGSAWSHNSLTKLAPGAADPKSLSHGIAIAGHATDWNKQQHVFYVDVSGHINELVFMD